ncbi:hypothetical protein CPC08DRAFT_819580 [Agrocybe pediades]|nr:hypothetical protein CPC08DRAFT_819580 [Agrocybe pediades]
MRTVSSSSAPTRRLQAVASHTTSDASSSPRDKSKDTFLLILPDGGKVSYRFAAVEGEENEVIVNDTLVLTYTISEARSFALEVTSQVAGTTSFHRRGWLLNPKEPFPYQPSFTRSEKVIASHPLRPPKPQPGEILYRRWCTRVNQNLEGIHDGSRSPDGVSRHLAAFHRWHNDERVNKAWGEAGSLEAHRKYLETVIADSHVLPCIFSWDGEPSGYFEIPYVKEDHVAQHYSHGLTPGDWDRGIHVLNGESKFAGRDRSEIWMSSLLHYIFLADPRTTVIVGEPNYSNQAIIRLTAYAGFHTHTIIDLPYKRLALIHNPRDKFFKLCLLW